MAGQVHVETEGHVGRIIFDHAERRNAITAEMWQAIPDIAQELDHDADIRVVVMRGAGDVAFVSGADISQFGEHRKGPQAEEYDRNNARAFTALAGLRKPLIAMIHGYCVGGGCAIAITADLRYADQDAIFAIPAARLGLGYNPLGIEMLVNTVGFAAAKEIFFTARRLKAAEAYHLGLVNEVVPKADLREHVERRAREIAQNAPLTIRAAKLAMRELTHPHESRDTAAVAAAVHACYASDDYKEGVQAFLEKRAPKFEGR